MLMEISLELLHSNVLPRKNRRKFCSFKRLPELNLTKKTNSHLPSQHLPV